MFPLLNEGDIETTRVYLEPVKAHVPEIIILALEIQAAIVGSVPYIESVIRYYGFISPGVKHTRHALRPEKVSDLLHGKLLEVECTELTLQNMLF